LKELKDYLYYEEENPSLKIYCGDCLEIMPLLPKVDLVVTDPPYGIGEAYDTFEDTSDNVKALAGKVIPFCLSITKRMAVSCATRQITFYPQSDWILCWFNKAGSGMNPWGFTCWQPILVYGKDPYLENKLGSRPDYIEHCETSPKNGHPCPKPTKFWKKLMIRVGAEYSDSILDPFLGSGTTLVACKELNRNGIGIEINPKYCEIAKKRLQNTQRMML
jgi:DNA modification methylase